MEEKPPKKSGITPYNSRTARIAASKVKRRSVQMKGSRTKTFVQIRRSLQKSKKEENPQLSKEWFKLRISKYLTMSHADLLLERKNRKNEAIDVWIISIISQGIRQGNQYKLEFITEQLFGKLPSNVNVEKTDTTWATVVTDLEIDDNSQRSREVPEEPSSVHQERPRLISGSKSDQDH